MKEKDIYLSLAVICLVVTIVSFIACIYAIKSMWEKSKLNTKCHAYKIAIPLLILTMLLPVLNPLFVYLWPLVGWFIPLIILAINIGVALYLRFGCGSGQLNYSLGSVALNLSSIGVWVFAALFMVGSFGG